MVTVPPPAKVLFSAMSVAPVFLFKTDPFSLLSVLIELLLVAVGRSVLNCFSDLLVNVSFSLVLNVSFARLVVLLRSFERLVM